jgi:FkbM family methyltransferase
MIHEAIAWVHNIIFNRLILRKDSTDYKVYSQIFLNEELKLPIPITAKTIIDLGAYTGISATYFINKYKGSYVIALEPDYDNYKILEKNANNKNIVCLNKAAWNKNETLDVFKNNYGEWASTVQPYTDLSKKQIVAGITINSLLAEYNIKKIDIIKIDIEGSEKILFSGELDWLDITENMIIELHPEFIDGLPLLNDIMLRRGFKYHRNGEKIIYQKQAW